jgi:hypothetical protein
MDALLHEGEEVEGGGPAWRYSYGNGFGGATVESWTQSQDFATDQLTMIQKNNGGMTIVVVPLV